MPPFRSLDIPNANHDILEFRSRSRDYVKCGGPSVCSRCRASGRSCNEAAGADTSHNDLAIISTPGSITSHTLSFDLPGSTRERRFMHFFQDQTAPDLSGCFNSSFWNRLVLQSGRREPAIHHALVALSAAHETFKMNDLTDYIDVHHQFPMQQYNKAIQHLSSHLSNNARWGTEIALICCMIFICFESVRGNLDSALAHLQSGLNIMRDWRRNKSSRNPELVGRETLIKMFLRLEIQAVAFIRNSRQPQLDMLTASADSGSKPDVSTCFLNLDQARESQEKLVVWLFRFLALNAEYQNVPPLKRPASVLLEHMELQTQFQLFSVAIDAFLENPITQVSVHDLRGAIALKLRQKVTYIMLTTSSPALGEAEKRSTDVIPEFRNLISLAESLVNDPDTKEVAPIPCFSFDTSVIAPLYYVAINCPDPALTQRAMQILSAVPRREGLFDAATVCKIAQKKAAVVQKGLLHINSPEASSPEIDVPIRSTAESAEDGPPVWGRPS